MARSCSSSATHILPRRAPSWHCASRTRGGPRHRAGHTRHPGMVAPQPGPALPLGFLRPERHTAAGQAVQDGLAHPEGQAAAPRKDVQEVPPLRWARALACVRHAPCGCLFGGGVCTRGEERGGEGRGGGVRATHTHTHAHTYIRTHIRTHETTAITCRTPVLAALGITHTHTHTHTRDYRYHVPHTGLSGAWHHAHAHAHAHHETTAITCRTRTTLVGSA